MIIIISFCMLFIIGRILFSILVYTNVFIFSCSILKIYVSNKYIFVLSPYLSALQSSLSLESGLWILSGSSVTGIK